MLRSVTPRRMQILLVLAAVFAVAGGAWLVRRTFSPWGRDPFQARAAAEPGGLHPVRVNPGPDAPMVLATLPGSAGAAAVACSTCHTTRVPNVEARDARLLVDFHQGLGYRHGDLSCLSCHNAANYDTLRRADGTPVAYPQAVQLCAQCHGTHYRDYRHGSHGGMTGYWDLSAGPRARNTCLDCHDAHAPAYPRVQPVFPPQDRGARQQRSRAAHTGEDEGSHG